MLITQFKTHFESKPFPCCNFSWFAKLKDDRKLSSCRRKVEKYLVVFLFLFSHPFLVLNN